MKTQIQIAENKFEDMRIALIIAQIALEATIRDLLETKQNSTAIARQLDLDKVNSALADSDWSFTKRIYED